MSDVNAPSDTVTLKKDNSSAVIHLFGATLTSWKPNGKESLFVSDLSKFDKKTPIRGGVPVIFPQFGPWKYGPQHGFARREMWSLRSTNGSDSVTLYLEDSPSTREIWNHKFLFELTVTLISDSHLKMEALITNRGEDSFDFTFLLHTYFSVPDVTSCKVEGLKGCTYVDKVNNASLIKEENETVQLSSFTDRIYQKTPSEQILHNASNGRNIKIEKCNLPDTVVWNPWIENAKKMGDFGDDEWKNMICIEAGFVSDIYTLEPGKKFKASQILSV